jgi:hypothetical protein
MFKFSRSSKEPSPSPSPSPSQFANSALNSAGNSSLATTDIRRELVRVAFKDTMRITGVPLKWLDCKVIYIPAAGGGERIQVHLVIRKWSGHLLRYAVAFEKQLALCLDRYEPHEDHSTVEWVWKFAGDCECPFPAMPPAEEWAQKDASSQDRKAAPAAWLKPMPPTAATATKAEPAREFDLRDVFSDLKAEDLGPR